MGSLLLFVNFSRGLFCDGCALLSIQNRTYQAEGVVLKR